MMFRREMAKIELEEKESLTWLAGIEFTAK